MQDTQTREKIDALVLELAKNETYREMAPYIKSLFKKAQKELIINHCKLGMSDNEINKKTNIQYTTIAQTTTEYWQDKMKNKK